MKRSEMPSFIQAMYGTILGLSFYKQLVSTDKDLVFVNSWKEAIAVFKLQQVQGFILFMFTLVITAYDWFSYHKTLRRGGRNEKFIRHLPHICSLFFLSQMFVATENLKLQYWFAFAFWYTLSNIAKFLIVKSDDDREREESGETADNRIICFNWIKFFLHGILTAGSFWLLTYSNITSFSIAIPTIVIVIILWIIEHRLHKSKKKSTVVTEKSFSNIEDDVSRAEEDAKKQE